MKVLLQLGWFFKQRKKQYALGIAALVFVSILQLLPPKIIGYIVDDITLERIDSSWSNKMAHNLGDCRDSYVFRAFLLACNDFRVSSPVITDDA